MTTHRGQLCIGKRALLLACAFVVLFARMANAQVALHDVGNFTANSSAKFVSGDGTIVGGVSANSTFGWTSAGGILSLGKIAGQVNPPIASSASTSGASVLAGTCDNYDSSTGEMIRRITYWSEGPGWSELPSPFESPEHWDLNNGPRISANGSAIVAMTSSSGVNTIRKWNGETWQALPAMEGQHWELGSARISGNGSIIIARTEYGSFRWDGESWTQIYTPTGGAVSWATDLNSDGSVVVGSYYCAGCGESESTINIFRWTVSGGFQDLGWPSSGPSDSASVNTLVSSDGLVVAGTYVDSSGIKSAFRWTSTAGMQAIGPLEGDTQARIKSLNSDGSILVGDSFKTESEIPIFHAFRWTTTGVMSNLGPLPGGATDALAEAVNSDGSVVVGVMFNRLSSGQLIDTRAFRWTSAGVVSLGALATPTQPSDVSSNGAVVVGSSQFGNIYSPGGANNGNHGFRWTSGGGDFDLGLNTQLSEVDSQSEMVSGDGLVGLGVSRSSNSGTSIITSKAFRFSSAGVKVNLEPLEGDHESFIHIGNIKTDLRDTFADDSSEGGKCVSFDGAVAVGTSWYVGEGTFFTAVRWNTSGVPTNLGMLEEDNSSAALAVSSDGQVVVGASISYFSGSTPINPKACRWTSEGIQGLGFLPDTQNSAAFFASQDGAVVVGTATGSVEGTFISKVFRWTSAAGMVENPKWSDDLYQDLYWPIAVSSDGNVILGKSEHYSDTSALVTTIRPFLWSSATGMVELPAAINQFNPLSLSGDGKIVAGARFDIATSANVACIWTATLGLIDLKTYLTGQGIDMTLRNPSACGISADGNTIVAIDETSGIPSTVVVNGLYFIELPTISSVSPNVGLTTGGTAITITGTNLTGASSVTVGGNPATSVVVVSDTSITAVTPAGAAGSKNISVTTAGGTATLPSAFMYVTPTVLAWGAGTTNTSIFPEYGQCIIPITAQSGVSAIEGGGLHTVVLKGGTVLAWGINDNGQCTIPASANSGVSAIADGEAHTIALKGSAVLAWGNNDYGQCTIPDSANSGVSAIAGGGTHTIALKTGAVLAWGRNNNGQCTIPDSANSGVSAIAGGGFHTIALKDGAVLAWGYNGYGQCNIPASANSGVSAIAGGEYHTIALKAGAVLAWGDNGQGQCNIPASANSGVTAIAGGLLHTIALKDGAVLAWGDNVQGQCTIPDSANSGVTAIAGGAYHTIALKGGGGPAPTIASISPTSGSTVGGTTITIEGANLLSASSLTVGGVAATSVVVMSDTLITAVTPAGIAGAQNIAVTTVDGTATLENAFTFVVPAPTIASVSPSSGPTTGGTKITIVGTNLTGASSVSIGGTLCYGLEVLSDTTMTAVTYPFTGTRDVVVTTPGGTATATGAFTFIVPIPAPTIASVSPTSGTTAGGTAITITGDNLSGASSVTIGGVAATSVVVVDATSITAVTPAGTVGAQTIVVTTAGGSTSQAITFTYVAAPTIASVSPSSGPIAGGTTITITGTNLTGASSVTIGGVAATSVNVVSATSITASTPAGTVGAKTIVVTTSGGPTSQAITFTYVAAPTISSVSPNVGLTTGGTAITITGTNFIGGSSVKVGGVAATSVVVVSDTSITAVTPAGAAGVKDVAVTTAGGTATLPSALSAFMYITPTVLAWGAGTTNTSIFPEYGQCIIPIAAQSGVSSIEGGGFHTIALKAGAVLAWGNNANGQCIIPIAAQSGVSAIEGGGYHTIALKAGTVLAWGDNDNGQCNVPAAALSGVSAIAGGAYHTIALKGSAVLAWGNNDYGQCNIPTDATRGVTAIASSGWHNIVLKGGTVFAWGWNNFGQCNIPTAATNGVTAIASGDYHSIALKDGAVMAWGAGTTNTSIFPEYGQCNIPAAALNGVTAIAGGGIHTVALKDGAVLAWGNNVYSQCNIPTAASSGVTAIASDGAHTIALKGGGGPAPTIASISPTSGSTLGGTTITIEGANLLSASSVTVGGVAATSVVVMSDTLITAVTPAGIAGAQNIAVTTVDGTATLENAFTFVVLAPTIASVSPSSGITAGGTAITITGDNLSGASSVTVGGIAATSVVATATSITAVTPAGAAGAKDVVVTTAGGTVTATGAFKYVTPGSVVAWGYNQFGQSTIPLAAQSGVFAIACGVNHTMALKDGEVFAWGSDASSQCTVPSSAQSGVSAIAGGGYFSIALKAGAVLAWGDNGNGQCTVPVAAQSGVTAIAGGQYHTIALKVGAVLGWGNNGSGRSTTPVAAQSGVTAIACGYYHTLALKAGEVLAWGENIEGQCTIPIAAQSGVTAIAGGMSHSIALKDGQVLAWGQTNAGQCTVPVVAQSGVTAIAGCAEATIALKDGQVFAWGSNSFGQCLGTDSNGNAITSTPTGQPVQVRGSVLNGVTDIVGGQYHASALKFASATQPQIYIVSPSSGPTTGGTTITIGGLNLTGATVKVGGANATVLTNTETSITATTPAGTAGAQTVSVDTSSGTFNKVNAFTYVVVLAPTITSVSPSSGPTTGGTKITIVGTNLTGASSVSIGGALCYDLAVLSDTTITAFTYPFTGTRDVVVTTPGGTATAKAAFSYINIVEPTDVAASDGLFTDKIAVTWSATANAIGYQVLRGIEKIADIASGATTSYNDSASTLIPGTSYTYTVKAVFSAGISEASAGDAGFVGYAIAVPTGVAASDGTSTSQIAVTWSATANAIGYQVLRDALKIADIASGATTSYNDVASTLIPGTSYTYTVKAVFTAGVSAPSIGDAGFVGYALVAPTGVAASDGTSTSQIAVTWSATANAIGYQVLRDALKIADIASGATTSYNDAASTLIPGTSYTYTVKAVFTAGVSAPSTGDTGFVGSALVAPTGVAASDGTSTSQIAVTWNATVNAIGYQVLRDGDKIADIESGATTSYNDAASTLIPGTLYTYTVKAVFAAGISAPSTGDTGFRKLSAPTSVACAGAQTGFVRITWNAAVGATSYEIFRNGTTIGTSTTTQYDDLTATIGVNFSYAVKSVAATGSSELSTPPAIGWRAPEVPTGLNATDGTFTNMITVSWNAVSGATGYEVKRDGAIILTAQVQTTTTFNDVVAVGQTFSYTVTASTAAGLGATSAANTGFINVLAPSNVAATDGAFTTKVDVTWNSVASAVGYQIFRSGTTGAIGSTTSALAYSDTLAVPGQKYNYYVKAISAAGLNATPIITSAASLINSGYRKVSAPLAVNATDGLADKVTVTWAISEGATGYTVYRIATGGVKTLAGSVTGNAVVTCDDVTATMGTLYTYTVVAASTAGVSDASVGNTGYRMAPPTGVRASEGTLSTQVLITWTAAVNATGYQVLRRTNSADTPVIVATVGGTLLSASDTSASSNVVYIYSVRANSAAGFSSESLTDTGYRGMPAPTGVAASDGEFESSIRVTWTPIVGAIGYEVWRNGVILPGGSVGSSITTYENGSDSAESQVNYLYTVKARFSSTQISAASIGNYGWRGPAPKNVSASNDNATMVKVIWRKMEGVQIYRVFRDGVQLSIKMAGDADIFLAQDTTAIPGVSYNYTVRAVLTLGLGPRSVSVSGMRLSIISALVGADSGGSSTNGKAYSSFATASNDGATGDGSNSDGNSMKGHSEIEGDNLDTAADLRTEAQRQCDDLFLIITDRISAQEARREAAMSRAHVAGEPMSEALDDERLLRDLSLQLTLDEDMNGVIDACQRAAGDIDLNGVIDDFDIAEFFDAFERGDFNVADLNQDGEIDGADIGHMLIMLAQVDDAQTLDVGDEVQAAASDETSPAGSSDAPAPPPAPAVVAQ